MTRVVNFAKANYYLRILLRIVSNRKNLKKLINAARRRDRLAELDEAVKGGEE